MTSSSCQTCGAPLSEQAAGMCLECLWGGVSGSAWEDDQPTMSAAAPPPAKAWDGGKFTVPGFEVRDVIARGGMGIVYRAWQHHPPREVALKMLLTDPSQAEQARQRFRVEAQAMAALDHSSILPIYGSGETSGMPYFTMKLAAGGALAQRRDRYQGQESAVAELMAQLGEAVAYAHEHGVLHRDLKPGNILFDEKNHPYVSDFGLARLGDVGSGATHSEAVIGTPNYLAPEIVREGAKSATMASDVWGLGAILYELLAGRPPFQADSVPLLLRKILEEDPPPLARSATGKTRMAGDELNWIAFKALEKDPKRRYATARAFADDLRRLMSGEAVEAGPPTAWYRWRKLISRHRVAVSAAMAIAASLIIGAGVSVYQAWRARKAEDSALRRLYVANLLAAQRDLKDGRLGGFRESLAEADPAYRGWEWHYLRGQSRSTSEIWPAGQGRVTHVTSSPSGDLLLTCGADGSLALWPREGKAPSARISSAHRGPAISASFSPDGRLACSVGADLAARIWDVERKTLIRSLHGHLDVVRHVAWSPKGDRVVTASDDGALLVWDAASGELLTARRLGTSIHAIAWRPNSTELAVTKGEFGFVALWDVETNAWRANSGSNFLDLGPFDALAWSADGQELAIGTRKRWVLVFDPDNLRFAKSPTGGAVRSIQWLDRESLVSAGDDQVLNRWHCLDGKLSLVDTLEGHSGVVRSVVAHRAGLLSAGDDGTLRRWAPPETANHDEAREDQLPPPFFVAYAAWSPDGRWLTYADTVGKMLLTSPTKQEAGFMLRDSDKVIALAWSPTAEHVAAAIHGPGGGVSIWDVEAKKDRDVSANVAVLSLGWSHDGRWLGVLGADGRLRIWDVPSGEQDPRASPLENGEPLIVDAAWHPREPTLATVDRTGVIRLRDGATGAKRREFPPLEGGSPGVELLRWSADGAMLALGLTDGGVAVLDVKRGKLRFRRAAHTGAVSGLSWSPDGRRLASGGQDGAVKLLDAETGEEVMMLDEFGDGVCYLQWSPDGRFLSGGPRDGILRLWDGHDDPDESAPPPPLTPPAPSEAFTAISLAWTKPDRTAPEGQVRRALDHVSAELDRAPNDLFLRLSHGLLSLKIGQSQEGFSALQSGVLLGKTQRNWEPLCRQAAMVGARVLEGRSDSARAGLLLAEARRIPARDPAAPESALDLTERYHASLDFSWRDNPWNETNTLAPFGLGLHQSKGVTFDARGVIQLAGLGLEPVYATAYPESVKIPVTGKARRIHVLHGMGDRARDGEEVARYIARFADGSRAVWSIKQGTDLARWWRSRFNPVPKAVHYAHVAPNPDPEWATNWELALCQSVWENPHPEKELVALMLESAKTPASPFVLAITLER